MYAPNASILHGKEKTGRIMGTWHQYLVNVSDNLVMTSFKYLHFKYKQFLWKTEWRLLQLFLKL